MIINICTVKEIQEIQAKFIKLFANELKLKFKEFIIYEFSISSDAIYTFLLVCKQFFESY